MLLFRPIRRRRPLERVLVEGKGRLGDPWVAGVIIHPLAIGEALPAEIGEGQASQEVILADDAQGRGLHRAAFGLHRLEQPIELIAVETAIDDERLQARPRHAELGQELLLLGHGGEAAELGDQLADGAYPAELPIVLDLGRDQSLEAVEIVPLRRRRIGWPPPLPGGVGRLVDLTLVRRAAPSGAGAG